MHDCKLYLVETANIMTTDTNIKYKVFICEECKKYYVERFNMFLSVQYNQTKDKWIQTGEIIK